jgi:hypothetical protein
MHFFLLGVKKTLDTLFVISSARSDSAAVKTLISTAPKKLFGGGGGGGKNPELKKRSKIRSIVEMLSREIVD